MKRLILAAAAATLALSVPATAKCADEIKAMQGKAAGSDAAQNPGSQANTSAPGTVPKEGGGEKSASAKILEAQAHDQRGDEAACMKAVEAARKESK